MSQRNKEYSRKQKFWIPEHLRIKYFAIGIPLEKWCLTVEYLLFFFFQYDISILSFGVKLDQKYIIYLVPIFDRLPLKQLYLLIGQIHI